MVSISYWATHKKYHKIIKTLKTSIMGSTNKFKTQILKFCFTFINIQDVLLKLCGPKDLLLT